MSRWIDADALRDRFQNLAYDDWNQGTITTWANAFAEAADVVDDMPAADVAPVRHGKWVYGENEGQDGWYCSECHFFIPWYYDWYGLDNIDFIKDFHACPHCSAKMVTYTGAKMDGGEDGEVD